MSARAFLYVRVSTRRQEDGTSPEAQERVMREYCAREGLEVAGVVRDADWSGGWTIRPGLDELRERVRAGEASVIVVSVRDRFARGVYAQVLQEEFEELGARLVALDSLGTDETPETELFDGIKDLFSGYEKRRIVQRMNDGRLERARSGRLLPTRKPDFGFKYAPNRDNYEVVEPEMALVRRIFRLIGAQGETLYGVKRVFEREGIPSPSGNRHWDPSFIKKVVLDDVYKPHSYQEIRELVGDSAVNRLDEGAEYGVFWFNRFRTVVTPERVPGGGVRKRKKRIPRPREEWIAIPVAHAGVGVSRDLVAKAREAISGNQATKSKGERLFELSGGLVRCQECGRALQTYARWDRRMGKYYYYYRCQSRARYGTDACGMRRSLRAQELDAEVWAAVRALLTRPDLLERGYEELLAQEARGGEQAEAERWAGVLEACDAQEERLLDLYLDGGIGKTRYEARAQQLEERRAVAREELGRAEGREARLRKIERSREAVLAHYSSLTPGLLDRLEPEHRQRVYRMMHLEVRVDAGHQVSLGGWLVAGVSGEDFTTIDGITEVIPIRVVTVVGTQDWRMEVA